ncbi:TVP38/TMEM64 family protein [Caldisalinibacter kiritimatiensis]|uniref:TVP38/TMEM64 family membrane protein n=1 Tax=Caldisalinibacter kiritimatiensis TaxID=1304284 RepID=R1AVB7_9FIRM|nr:VTT domain-containing protein [Caldisalinibacter kiritimatiensis]EOD00592.1 DedA family protein, putative [Caldisalinibacter kiritimatiensis]
MFNKFSIYDKAKLTQFFYQIRENPNCGIIFIIMTAGLSMLFVPISWMVATSAILFGFKWGLIYSISGAIISSILSFFLGRIFKKDFREFIMRRIRVKDWNIDINSVSYEMQKSGFKYVLLLRNIPMMPFTLVNYIAGFTSVKFKDYIIGSFLGMIPGMAIAIYLFSRVIDIRKNPKGMIIPLVLASLYYIGIFLWNKKLKER